ncbi:MAG: hypothetical protein U9P71_07000 [Campylobacterota bacterium]|nr:hypothetical protein [Campylobacterota bacterium]
MAINTLSWLNPEVNMNLSFSGGEKDIADVPGLTFEHSHGDPGPGVYPISISGSSSMELSDSCQETIGVSVSTPGGSAFFTIEAKSTAELNLGNVI